MSSKNLPCMKPEPITFIVRSTCASCPALSCVNTSATSPNSTVSRSRSIGRYESATPNAPHRCTTNRPLSVSCRPPSLNPATHMPRRRNDAASGPKAARSRPRRRTPPPGAVSMWCMCSSISSGASTAPVSIVRSAAGAALSAAKPTQPSSASRSWPASRATIPGASEYTASHTDASDAQLAAATVAAGAAYAPPSLTVTQPSTRNVRRATCNRGRGGDVKREVRYRRCDVCGARSEALGGTATRAGARAGAGSGGGAGELEIEVEVRSAT